MATLQRTVVSSSVVSGIPQGMVLEWELFITLISNMDSGVKCALSTFANDTKLCGAVNTLEGRDAIQRDRARPERWRGLCQPHGNSAKPNARSWVRKTTKHKYRLVREWTESSPG